LCFDGRDDCLDESRRFQTFATEYCPSVLGVGARPSWRAALVVRNPFTYRPVRVLARFTPVRVGATTPSGNAPATHVIHLLVNHMQRGGQATAARSLYPWLPSHNRPPRSQRGTIGRRSKDVGAMVAAIWCRVAMLIPRRVSSMYTAARFSVCVAGGVVHRHR
jgi:hypothetical protein